VPLQRAIESQVLVRGELAVEDDRRADVGHERSFCAVYWFAGLRLTF
jgi:hypothetical protein